MNIGHDWFEVVLLATYPRSGNSWTCELFTEATRIGSRLTTVNGLDELVEVGQLAKCRVTECPTQDIALALIQSGLK